MKLRTRRRLCPTVTSIVFAAMALAASGVRAQSKGSVAGTIRDHSGKPWPTITVTFRDSTGHVESVVSTRADGKYSSDLPAGNYTMELRDHGRIQIRIPLSIFANIETPGNVDFKSFPAGYENLQQHFEAGEKELAQIKKARDEISRLQSEIDLSGSRAVAELQQALFATNDNDDFFHRFSVLAKLGDTYDAIGEYSKAAGFYSQAVALHQDSVAFDDLSNDLAKSGQFDEAAIACNRSAELDPSRAPHALLNLAINLYNARRFKDAVAAARRSARLDSANPKSWYVLASSLAGTITFVQSGSKMSPVLPDGLPDAYEKSIALDPNGKWGHLAQDGLHELQQMMLGIETKASLKPIR